ncbi:hypothetical protein AS026_29670 [Rhizobium altiplani]|uniref:Peptidase M16 N-terminal domain-containing protein n=2 Tax=Rhizobium TaxID=379 RepID=K0Q6N4_9HYPH|nr:hypothetical protein AS026_29670 [Rhizobium altiplani]CCM80164.1 exported hypothetical protein [Rhizobium mesoamericanum STM3625]
MKQKTSSIMIALGTSLALLLVWDAMAFKDRIQDSAMSDFVLQNGIEVVVIPDHRIPIVTQMVWYRAGAADGPSVKSGIAHFLEHLMFKGTKTHKAEEFDKAVAETGGEENAFTSFDYTAFYQTVVPLLQVGEGTEQSLAAITAADLRAIYQRISHVRNSKSP